MKRNCLIPISLEVIPAARIARRQRGLLTGLTVLVVSCILLLQIGCQEQAVATEGPETALAEPKPAVSPGRPTKAEAVPEAAKPAPKITFEKVVHNLGEISPGTKNVCEFKFTNTGDALLKITKVSKTCGCTPFTLAKKEYAPGESGTVKVTYNASSHSAKVTKRLYVSSNDKTKPKVTLTIKAKIAAKVAHEPKELKLLLKDEEAGPPKITLSSLDNQPFAITSFKSTKDCVSAAFDSSVKATKFVLEVKTDIEKLKKNLKGHIRIRLTHPKCSMVTIPFNVLPRFNITPRAIVVREAVPQKPIKREAWILNNYGEDFEVESASSEKEIIKVLSQKKVDNRYKFELEITPPTTKDKRPFNDVFYVNLKGGEKLSIGCRGFYSKKSG